MTTSATSNILSEIIGVDEIDEGALAYLERRLAYRFYAAVLKEFIRQKEAGLISTSVLAKRIRREPAQVSRWLSGESNWTTKTVSALLGGMGTELGPITVVSLAGSAAAGAGDTASNKLVSEIAARKEADQPPHAASGLDLLAKPTRQEQKVFTQGSEPQARDMVAVG